MRYASVCSGVEAASLAWLPLGWECAWLSEIEPFPCEVLAQRFTDTPNLGDMTKIHYNKEKELTYVDGSDVTVNGGIDLLVGGTPCQSFSVAGKREGLDGASGLAKHFVRLLSEIQPKIFVWENVPGCLSSKTDGVYDFNFLLCAYAECGYNLAWRILDAQYVRVDGYPRAIPQRRRRVFVVGCLASSGLDPAKILFEPTSLLGDTPPRRVKGKGFTADVERCVGETGTTSNGDDCYPCIDSGLSKSTNHQLESGGGYILGVEYHTDAPRVSRGGGQRGVMNIEKQEISPVLRAKTNHHEPLVCYEHHPQDHRVKPTEVNGTLGTFGNSVEGKDTLVHTFNKVSRPKGKDGVGERWEESEKSATLNVFDQGDVRAVDLVCAVQQNGSGDTTLHAVAPSLSCNTSPVGRSSAIALAENTIGRQPLNGGNGTGYSEELAYTQNATGVMGVSQSASVRRLLPVECERLMGFPDNWTRIKWRGKSEEECPDAPRYKACGNSMCVNVMRWIGMRIEQETKGVL